MKNYFAGSDWIRNSLRAEVSEFGAKVADLVGEWQRGIYHLSGASLRKVNWKDSRFIELVVGNSLATTDFNELTLLVLLAHDRCVRVEISGAAPGYLRLYFTKRERTDSSTEGHPTIETALQKHRSRYPLEAPTCKQCGLTLSAFGHCGPCENHANAEMISGGTSA